MKILHRESNFSAHLQRLIFIHCKIFEQLLFCFTFLLGEYLKWMWAEDPIPFQTNTYMCIDRKYLRINPSFIIYCWQAK